MNSKSIKIAVAVLLFLGLIAILDYISPNQVKWVPTLSNTDSQPYGTKATFECLPELFDVQPTSSRRALYLLNRDSTTGKSLVLADIFLRLSRIDIESLLNFAERGNDVMLFSETFPKELLDTLQLKNEISYTADTSKSGTFYLKTGQKLVRFKNVMRGNEVYFGKTKGSRATILGFDYKKQPNFMLIPWGKGKIYLHSDPITISNLNLLYGNHAYISSLFGNLRRSAPLIWDEHYKSKVKREDNSLEYIFANPSLRMAYYMLLIAAIIYLTAFARRRQRIVPVIDPPRNISLDFIKTISRLYFFERDNKDIATKKISYFFDRINSRTGHRFTTVASDTKRMLLADLYSCPIENVDEFYAVVAAISSAGSVDNKTILELDRLIYKIEKNNSIWKKP